MPTQMNVVNVKISDIKTNPNNPRLIKDDKFEKLVKSIKDFPEMLRLRPIVVNSDMVVLGGNMRLKACKEAGLKEVPIIRADELTEDQQREFIIKDNVGYGEWEWDIIRADWDVNELSEWGLDIPEFHTTELEAVEDDYEMPDQVETDIVLGDLFEIGEHRLLCGDSTDSDAVDRLMNGEKADMVFTDPPYGVDVKNTQGSILGDGDLNVFINSLPIIKLFADENAHFYVWCASGDMFPPSLAAFVDILPFQNILPIRVTHENKRGKKGAFKLNFETCLFGNNNERSFNSSGRFKVSETTLNDNRYKGDGKLKVYPALWDEERSTEHNMNIVHPTQKNVGMVLFYVEISSKASDIVLDLFLGSGTTMVAAHQLKRRCYGMELDPKYCQVIVDRMLKLDPTLTIKRNGEPYQVTGEKQVE
jgi:DNA modification methylase